MRTFVAFSRGALMYRVLANILGKEDMDEQKWRTLTDSLKDSPDELKKAEDAMTQAQELVKDGGVFEKFIDEQFLKGGSNPDQNADQNGNENVRRAFESYKSQFRNWLWVALADSNEVFSKYVTSFSENGVQSNSTNVTGLVDRLTDFAVHMKYHADYAAQCREILNRLSSNASHISIADFSVKMLELDEDWNSRKKYIITQETVEEAWKEIMQPSNKVDVDGDWGTFAAYRIPNWNALMQVGHQTRWCVAQKGESGESYYQQYGEPYYLICDSDRHPFALMNPPSSQFKDVRDDPIRVQNNGDILPSHRRAILFGKAVLDKVSPNDSLYGDFNCFRQIDKIMRLDEEDRNDTTDYNAVLDEYYRMKENDERRVEQVKPKKEEKEETKKTGNPLVDYFNGDRSNYFNGERKWDALPQSEKDETVDFIMDYDGKLFIPDFVVDYIAFNRPDDVFRLMSDTSKTTRGYFDHESIASRLAVLIHHRPNDFVDKTLATAASQEKFLRKLHESIEYEKEKIYLAQFVLSGSKCSDGLVKDILGSVDLKDSNLVGYVADAVENGILDKGMWEIAESSVIEKYDHFQYSRRDSTTDIDLSDTITKMLCSGNCTEDFRKKVFEKEKRNSYWGSEYMIGNIIKGDNGEIVDSLFDELETMPREKLEAKSGWDSTNWKIAALCNPRCPDGLAHRLAERVEYGKGYRIDISEQHYKLSMNIYYFLLSDGILDADDFMKFVKTSPRLVIGYGWRNRHCTEVVKLALVKKVAKQNGGIFTFDKDESPLVLNEFFKVRISGKKYGEFIDAFRSGVDIPKEIIMFALEKIDPRAPKGDDAIKDVLRSNKLGAEDMVEIARKYESDSLLFRRDSGNSWLINNMFERKDCPREAVEIAFQSNDFSSVQEYVRYGGKDDVGFMNKVIDYVRDNRDSTDEGISFFCRNIVETIYENENCPVEFIRDNFKFLCDRNSYRRDTYLAKAIRKKALDIKTIVEALDERQSNYSNVVNEILKSEGYTDAEKSMFMSKIDLQKLSCATLVQVAQRSSGKSMFKRLALALNYDNDDFGYALAMAEQFPREWIAPYINRNYGVTKGYAKRFGVDKVVLDSKYLRSLITDDKVELRKEDVKKILAEGEEDAAWMLKKRLRAFAKSKGIGVNASVVDGIAMRVASEAMDIEWRTARIAARVASEF